MLAARGIACPGRLLWFADVASQPLSELLFAHLSSRNSARDGFKLLRGRQACDIVETEESKGGHHRRAFVAIHKGVVLGDVKQISCRHRGDVFVQEGSAELLTRHRDSGVQQAMISQSV